MDFDLHVHQVPNIYETRNTIAAFDPGGHTGLSIINTDGQLCVYGVIQRLHTPIIATFLTAILKQYDVSTLVCEKYVGRVNASAITQKVVGRIYWIAGQLDIPIFDHSPAMRTPFLPEALLLLDEARVQESAVIAHIRDATAHALCYYHRLRQSDQIEKIKQAAATALREA